MIYLFKTTPFTLPVKNTDDKKISIGLKLNQEKVLDFQKNEEKPSPLKK